MGDAQGTTYSIKVIAAARDVDPPRVESVIRNRLDKIDQAFSLYRADSELSRFNAFADTAPFKASPELIEAMRIAREVSVASGGAFDVTVFPLVEAWGFGPQKRDAEPPETAIAAARARVGYEKVVIDEQDSTLRKTQPDVMCDLNGIAQGYAVDKLAADLGGLGLTRYLIELGGEVKAYGMNKRDIPWQVGVERPVPAGRAPQSTVPLDYQAMSTSGDYRKYRETNGQHMSHAIDPRTGAPVAHSLASVSVIHQSCAVADAWATALMVLGTEEGFDAASRLGVRASFIVRDGNGKFAELPTDAFGRVVASHKAMSMFSKTRWGRAVQTPQPPEPDTEIPR